MQKNMEKNKHSTNLSKSKNRDRDDDSNYSEASFTEVSAYVSVPTEGGWGWVVVICAFFSILILDGVAYTFGSLLKDIAKDLRAVESVIALVNSTAVALYFTASPVASALINKFGFRTCAMSGSVICSLSIFLSHIAQSLPLFFCCYGVMAGFGYSLMNMSSGLIVGFYFERLRPVALAIASCGSSVGVMTMFPANTYLVNLGGWRTTTLLHSGLLGITFFLGMAYRPLLTVDVRHVEEGKKGARSLVRLHSNISHDTKTHTDSHLLKAASNRHFPTAAELLNEVSEHTEAPTKGSSQPGTSKSKSRLMLATLSTGESQLKQLKQVQSHISKYGGMTYVEEPVKQEQNKKGWIRWCCWWEPHTPESHPMYRDDAFYSGNVENLPIYQKSMASVKPEERTGLEYQMAVTRVTVTEEGTSRFSISRILATMFDTTLLKHITFVLMCISGFFTYLGYLVPYVYLQDRCLTAGMEATQCNLLMSIVGLSNACGRLIIAVISSKLDAMTMYALFMSLSGLSTMISDFYLNIYYQYLYCFVFGFSTSVVVCLRSIILVEMYGLDKLTNATGMLLIFLGLGNLLSSPLAGILKKSFGFRAAFLVAGIFMSISGIIIVFVKLIYKKELRSRKQEEDRSSKTNPQSTSNKSKPQQVLSIKDAEGSINPRK